MYLSVKEFTVRAGSVIFAISIVIWALSYFPHPAAEGGDKSVALERSFLGTFGKAVQPAFAPAGFDWKTTVAVLAAFPAREVVVSTLGILYSAEDDEENKKLTEQMIASKSFTVATAAAVMVFFAFCMQCGSTVAIMARESSWKWAGFAFVYMTTLAWVGAVATYQIGRSFGW